MSNRWESPRQVPETSLFPKPPALPILPPSASSPMTNVATSHPRHQHTTNIAITVTAIIPTPPLPSAPTPSAITSPPHPHPHCHQHHQLPLISLPHHHHYHPSHHPSDHHPSVGSTGELAQSPPPTRPLNTEGSTADAHYDHTPLTK